MSLSSVVAGGAAQLGGDSAAIMTDLSHNFEPMFGNHQDQSNLGHFYISMTEYDIRGHFDINYHLGKSSGIVHGHVRPHHPHQYGLQYGLLRNTQAQMFGTDQSRLPQCTLNTKLKFTLHTCFKKNSYNQLLYKITSSISNQGILLNVLN